MAIRHREVFPVGSSPDSIAWDIWNDDHVGDAAGLPQDQIDALDAANAPDGSNPFATMADVAAGGVSMVDLGVVEAVDLLAGPQLLYTTTGDELIKAVFFDAVSRVRPPSTINMIFTTHPESATEDEDTLWMAAYYGAWQDTPNEAVMASIPTAVGTSWPIQSGALYVAMLCSGGFAGYVRGAWQAAHVYNSDGGNTNNDQIVEAGHIWAANPGGTSGASEPDFAGNIGGTVTDNGISWTDVGVVPAVGEVRVYLEVFTPVAP